MVIAGKSNYVPRFINSLIIAFGSTFLAVTLGVFSAYAFSRFKIPLADDILFFILSTRMMPPIAVAIPIYLMYRELGLSDTALGMILLYTAVNVSLSVWLLKGFIDEIPKEYEEAAMIDGYTRLHAFFKVVLPQAATGIAATAIFCLIFAWNEYAFAVSADLRHGADGTALHSDHHRRRRHGLASRWRGHHPVPHSHSRVHRAAAQAPAARHHLRCGAQMKDFINGLMRLRRDPWETLATVIIAIGVLMLLQPIAITLYTYSFVTTLIGTVMFIIVSKFPE